MAFHDLTLTEARDAIAARTLGSEDYTRALLDRIDSLDAKLGCFLSLFAERAIAQGRDTDRRHGMGEYIGPLAGVPIALKDNIAFEFGRTTCGSRILENYESPFSATAAARLERAGAIILGKTNCDEFAMGSSTENSAFQKTRNPWDPSRVPGGSSGGSAAAVAARLVPAALGSDTGGSVRQPAALCGVVGLKPTYGRVSRWGLVAYASSLDQIGPITRTVADAALIMETIAGRDELDSTCAEMDAPPLLAALNEPMEGLRLGVPRQCRDERNHPAVAAAFENAIETFGTLGAEIVEIDLPTLKHGVAAYYLVATAEASSNLARFDGVRYGRRAAEAPSSPDKLFDLYARTRAEFLGHEVQRRIMLGTYALSAGYYDAYYLTALKARRLVKNDFDRVFGFSTKPSPPPPAGEMSRGFASDREGSGVHAVLMPATVSPAFKIGEKTADPLAMYLEDVYTVTANLAGIPAISMPMGFANEGGSELPFGLQILAPAFEEERLLRIARMYERVTGHAKRAPVL